MYFAYYYQTIPGDIHYSIPHFLSAFISAAPACPIYKDSFLHRTHRVDIDFPAGGIDHTQEWVQVWAARDHLPAILAVHTLHQRGSGADDVGLRQAKTSNPGVELFAQQQGLVL